jgi:hypothetical protein
MKAAITLISTMITAMLAVPMASAQSERIATGGAFDSITRLLTNCTNCRAMETLRTQVFVPAHANTRLHSRARASVGPVVEQAERLSVVAENDSISLRNAHYANEITAFYYLAADALPYAEDLQIAETIAYLNQTLGSRDIFERVLNLLDEDVKRDEKNSCRRDFFKQAVENKECISENELAADEAKAAKPPRRHTPKTCRSITMSVKDCETKKALSRGRP